MKPEQNRHSFIQWFRDSSPYIHAHRGRTFVVMIPGEIIGSDIFNNLIHDVALLNSLGIKLILVHGARKQIDERLLQYNIDSEFKDQLRITTNSILQHIKSCVGHIRVEFEALLSQGLINTPMAGARIRVVSGNFISAKPLGVKQGINYQQTGQVRRIDRDAIHEKLQSDNIILLSPLGYSPSGEVFNLNACDLAFYVAQAMQADKLLLLVDGKPLLAEHNRMINRLSLSEAQALQSSQLEQYPTLYQAIDNALKASRGGVKRVHLIDQATDGALLLELFSRDGCGTLIGDDSYESVRPATIDDIAGILELIRPQEEAGTLVKRSRELLESEITHFTVVERDGMIVGCAALYPFAAEKSAEIACMTVHPQYTNFGFGDYLLGAIESQARSMKLDSVFALTTNSAHWFVERGFQQGSNQVLPDQKQRLYNYQRKSMVFIKPL